MYLETKNVMLREINPCDEDRLFELNSDPEVMRYLTNGVPSTREYVRETLPLTLATLRKHNGRFGRWAAIEKKSQQFMGWFFIQPDNKDPDNTRRLELGYRLKKIYWGMGYATEVAQALITKAFLEPEVQEIYAVTMKDNLASRKVMEKCGMTFHREFHHEDFPNSKDTDVEYVRRRG